jgi:hypothetical protein
MNRTQTSAIVLLLASAAAAYAQDAQGEFEDVRPVTAVDAAVEAGGSKPRRLLGALLACFLGRERSASRSRSIGIVN